MNVIPFADFLRNAMPTESVFVHHMPDSVDRGVLVLHNLNGAKRFPDLPDYKKAKFQVIVREVDYQSGYDFSNQILNALTVSRETLGPLYVHFINPLHDPVSFPVSKGDYIEFSVNYETVYVEH